MARNEKKASFVIEFVDKVSVGMRKVQSAFEDLKQQIAVLAVSAAGFFLLLDQSIRAWGEQEKAAAKLENAMRNLGGGTAGATARLEEFATALSKSTTFTDEQILASAAMLAQLGFTEVQIRALIPRVLDLAAATDRDLLGATNALGRALATGHLDILRRYNIILDEATAKSGDLTAITAALDKQFGGTAVTIGQTAAGSLERFKNELGEVMESFGQVISNGIRPFLSFGAGIAAMVQTWILSHRELVVVVTLATGAFLGVVTALATLGKAISVAMAVWKLAAAGIGLLSIALTPLTLGLIVVAGAVAAVGTNFLKLRDLAFQIMVEISGTLLELARAFEAFLARRIGPALLHLEKAFSVTNEHLVESWSNTVNEMDNLAGALEDRFSSAFENISDSGQGTIDDLQRQIDEFLRDMPTGQVPNPGGGSDGGTGSGGGSGGGSSGGPGTSPGQPGTPGDPNVPPIDGSVYDLFPPFDDPAKPPSPFQADPGNEWMWDALAKMWVQRKVPGVFPVSIRGAGRGSEPQGGQGAVGASGASSSQVNHITIQAGTIVASDQSVDEFARKIDKALYGLSRNRESSAL